MVAKQPAGLVFGPSAGSPPPPHAFAHALPSCWAGVDRGSLRRFTNRWIHVRLLGAGEGTGDEGSGGKGGRRGDDQKKRRVIQDRATESPVHNKKTKNKQGACYLGGVDGDGRGRGTGGEKHHRRRVRVDQPGCQAVDERLMLKNDQNLSRPTGMHEEGGQNY